MHAARDPGSACMHACTADIRLVRSPVNPPRRPPFFSLPVHSHPLEDEEEDTRVARRPDRHSQKAARRVRLSSASVTPEHRLHRGDRHSIKANVSQPVCRYPYVYLFKYQNMRNDKFKELREQVQENSKYAHLPPVHFPAQLALRFYAGLAT